MIAIDSISKDSVLNNYKNAINDVINYLKNNLYELEISSAIIYGSSTYGDVFIEGVSDIDIIAYTDKMSTMHPSKIIEILKTVSDNFKDKEPVLYIDHIGYRIEFYFQHPDISFDITLLPLSIPNFEKRETDASYDSLEMIIGALYENSVVLFGNIPCLDMVKKDYFPFYDDNLRDKRLKVLTKRIISYTKRVEILTENRDPNLLDHLYKTRNHFLKWLFIYKRKYPVNLSKHLNYQLEKLGLSTDEIEILQFLESGSLYEMANKYLDLSNKYLKLYLKEVNYEL
ncbi:MAG: hypothetical protein HFH45_05675 [Bacilli bacterium]|nr:hypothetical protein [Bacilli bacterium]